MGDRCNKFGLMMFIGLWAPFCSMPSTAAVPSAPPTICIDGNCVESEPPTNSTDGIKWHPGHYIAMGGTAFASDWISSFYREIDSICSNSSIKGVKLVKTWAALEGPAVGDYTAGFKGLDQVLSKLASCNKRLILHVKHDEFGSPFTSTPSCGGFSWWLPYYICKDPIYGSTPNRSGEPYGVAYSDPNVQWSGSLRAVAAVWNKPTMDRLIALKKAYGARYNKHPYFEVIAGGETAIGAPSSTGFSYSAYIGQLKRELTEVSRAWPNTQVRLNANWISSNEAMEDIIEYCASLVNCGVGGPDPELPLPNVEGQRDATTQSNRCFRKYNICSVDRRGQMPWYGEVQQIGLETKYFYTPAQIQAYQSNYMRMNYMVWQKNSKWSDVLAQINSSKGSVSSTACPGKFGRCITN